MTDLRDYALGAATRNGVPGDLFERQIAQEQRSGGVLPGSPRKDRLDATLAHPEQLSDLMLVDPAGLVQATDLYHLGARQFCGAALLADRDRFRMGLPPVTVPSRCARRIPTKALSLAVCVPPLADSISNIVEVGPKKQMARPNTRAIVALMADEQPCRNRPEGDLIDRSVCEHIAPGPAAPPDDPVAPIVDGAGPYPALTAMIDSAHQSFEQWHGTMSSHRANSSVPRPRMLTHRGGTFVRLAQRLPGVIVP